MTNHNNAARVAVQAEPCPNQALVRWIPVLMIEGEPLPDGITTTFYERLPSSFETAIEAMTTAWEVLRKRPDAIGASAKRMEVPYAA